MELEAKAFHSWPVWETHAGEGNKAGERDIHCSQAQLSTWEQQDKFDVRSNTISETSLSLEFFFLLAKWYVYYYKDRGITACSISYLFIFFVILRFDVSFYRSYNRWQLRETVWGQKLGNLNWIWNKSNLKIRVLEKNVTDSEEG